MFIKLTRASGHTYAQLVESFRDEHGRPRQRTLATIGRVDESGGQVDALLNGLLRAKGQPGVELGTLQVRFESALALGDVWALDQLWHELGFDRLGAIFRRARYTTSVEHAVRVMVFNRLCDADSKLGVLRWLETVAVPGVRTSEITHQQLLRSMDALMDHQDEVDNCVAHLLRPLIDEELDASSVTVQEFCLREGLTRSSFTRWRARLCDGARPWPAGRAGTVARVPADVPKPGFVDLGSLGEATAVERAGPVDLRIDPRNRS
jgi:hypothetical protein